MSRLSFCVLATAARVGSGDHAGSHLVAHYPLVAAGTPVAFDVHRGQLKRFGEAGDRRTVITATVRLCSSRHSSAVPSPDDLDHLGIACRERNLHPFLHKRDRDPAILTAGMAR
jgi:hypothetical protein